MESRPQAAVRFAVTKQRDFFGSRIRHAEWLEQEDKLVESLAVDESREKSFAGGVVEIVQGAQLTIVAQTFAQQVLIVAKQTARLVRCRSARLHSCIRRRLDLFESLVSEAQYQFSELFSNTVFASEDLEAVFFYCSGRRQR